MHKSSCIICHVTAAYKDDGVFHDCKKIFVLVNEFLLNVLFHNLEIILTEGNKVPLH